MAGKNSGLNFSGIYKITSKVHPERIYIGSAVNVHYRWNHHKLELKKGIHKNPKLQSHYNKYGADDLTYSVIARCSKEDLIPVDKIIWIEQCFFWAYKPWFNVHQIAGSPSGHTVSKEGRLKMSIAKKGKPSWNKGIKTGPQSEETKKKRSDANKGQVPWMKGKHHSDESIKKSSDSHKGQNTWSKGRKQSPESVYKRTTSFMIRRMENKLVDMLIEWNENKNKVA